MSAPTPGPWVVIESGLHGDNYLVCEDVPGRLRPICAMEHGHPNAEANAHFIATAPALRGAAIEAIALLDVAIAGTVFTKPDAGRVVVNVAKARAVLDALRAALAPADVGASQGDA